MKLSISNLGWGAEQDLAAYQLMRQLGYAGLEIAPTRVFPDRPYDDLAAAGAWREDLRARFGYVIPSMQSIWYGRQENLFGSEEERRVLMEYTQAAIRFAEAMGCENLVFGCPRNRAMPEGTTSEQAIPFFRAIGEYAATHHCVFALEANPPIYHTNFLNTTQETLAFIQRVDSEGCRLNLDVGTMIENGEEPSLLKGCGPVIHHVHISEPGLKLIERRPLHQELAALLREEGYDRYVSIEMGRQEDLDALARTMAYVREVFG